MMFTESIERSDVVVVAVMFLIAFVLSLLAFYARMPFLLYLAATLFAFCWVGKDVNANIKVSHLGGKRS